MNVSLQFNFNANSAIVSENNWIAALQILAFDDRIIEYLDTEVGRDTKLHSTVEKCYLYGTLTTNHLFSQVDI